MTMYMHTWFYSRTDSNLQTLHNARCVGIPEWFLDRNTLFNNHEINCNAVENGDAACVGAPPPNDPSINYVPILQNFMLPCNKNLQCHNIVRKINTSHAPTGPPAYGCLRISLARWPDCVLRCDCKLLTNLRSNCPDRTVHCAFAQFHLSIMHLWQVQKLYL